jgi:hypothetical protein
MQQQDRKGLKTAYLIGICAAILWAVAKTPPIARALTPFEHDTSHGDLYRQCPIQDFALPFPASDRTWQSPPVAEADALLIGDSFSNVAYGHPPLPALLSTRMGRPVAYASNALPNPLRMELPPETRTRRIVILEGVERQLIEFLGPGGRSSRGAQSGLLKAALDFRLWAFLENDAHITYLLTRNRLTRPIAEMIATARYRLLGEGCPGARVFSVEPPMLFLDEETGHSQRGYFYNHTPEVIEDLAANITDIAAGVKERGLEFVFVPVPNKVSIYHDLITDIEYDQFVPKLVAELQSRGVCVVDLVPAFTEMRRSGVQVYHPTDTHWTRIGAERAADMITEATQNGCSRQRELNRP